MPDLPNDPRLLAQEILAGRVSIQDLAREQARRRAAQANPGKPVAPPPGTPGNMRPSTGAYPPTRKATPPNRPAPRASTPSSGSQANQSPKAVRKPTVPARPNTTAVKAAPSRTAAPAQPAAAQNISAKAPRPGVVRSPKDREMSQVIRRVLASPQNTRTVYLISELLAPPIALRQSPVSDSPPSEPRR